MTQRTWLITGASRGLGRALAVEALATGARVIATVRGSHDLPSHECLDVIALDVRSHDDCQRAADYAMEMTGRIDVLINNAGFGLIGAIEEVSEGEAREITDTDLLGALWLTQAVLRPMRAQRSGHIIQISTVGAVGTMPTLGLYNAVKWGLEGFSEALAAEVAAFGIQVTIVQPGTLNTSWSTTSMRFANPLAPYNDLRSELFGTPDVPWPTSESAEGGSEPADAARIIVRHVLTGDDRLRLLVGDDAPDQVASALNRRLLDYERDPRWQGPSPLER